MPNRELREFEQQLDQHYKTLKICSRPENVRFYALLASYDSMLLPLILMLGESRESPGITLSSKTLDDSLNYCIKWLSKPKPKELMSTQEVRIIEEAGELLLFGSKYADIADMHMMYGRGLVKIEINKQKKSVKFVITDEDKDEKEIYGYLENYAFHRKISQQNARESIRSGIDFVRALDLISCEYRKGRIIITDMTGLESPEIRKPIENQMLPEILPLGENIDLGGFSFSDYKSFWLEMRIWSNCLLGLYLKSIKIGMLQETCMPTQLLEEANFISDMKKLANISEETIIKITERLSYNWGNKKAEILLQPFIRANKKILWSPSLILKSRYDRNMLKHMSRTQNLKSISDNIIGEREKRFLNLVGNNLARKYGYQFKLNTRIVGGSKETEIDILAYKTEFPTEVLIIEAKTILAVDETNEIADATNKLINAQQQIVGAISVLKSLTEEEKHRVFKFVNWKRVTDYYPILMTPDSHPNTTYKYNIVPHISYTSLLTFGRRRDLSRPSRIWHFCKNRNWIRKATVGKKYEYKDIKVGKITYSLPFIETKSVQSA